MFKNKTQAVAIASITIFFLSAIAVYAGAEQVSEIPGQGGTTNNLFSYLEALYNFAISVSGVLAIFMIAFGAFIYIVTSAGNSSKMADAKDMIFNSIIGLIIVLVAWLILFVVSPDLVRPSIAPTSGIDDYINL